MSDPPADGSQLNMNPAETDEHLAAASNLPTHDSAGTIDLVQRTEHSAVIDEIKLFLLSVTFS